MKQSTYDGTLRFINKILKKHGKKPVDKILPGNSSEAFSCPITQTLLKASFQKDRFRVGSSGMDILFQDLKNPVDSTEGKSRTFRVVSPRVVADFIEEIDSHRGRVDPLKLLKKKVKLKK